MKKQNIIEVNGVKFSPQLIMQLSTISKPDEMKELKNYLFTVMNHLLSMEEAAFEIGSPKIVSDALNEIHEFLNAFELIDNENGNVIEVNNYRFTTDLTDLLKQLAKPETIKLMKDYLFHALNISVQIAIENVSLQAGLSRFQSASYFIYAFLDAIESIEICDTSK